MQTLQVTLLQIVLCSLMASSLVRGCGAPANQWKATIHPRIIGGDVVEQGSWPWLAALATQTTQDGKINLNFMCGGTLISNRHILTAAHCSASNLSVARLGTTNLASTTGALDVLIERVVPHESFDMSRAYNDIAVVVLKEKVNFTELIRPICLPEPHIFHTTTYLGAYPYVAGWGETSYGTGFGSNQLRHVQLPIVPLMQCRHIYRSFHTNITINNLCAGHMEGGKDACQGDSGGPLMLRPLVDRFFVIGIISHGHKCALPGVPGVFTRVTPYLAWIHSIIDQVQPRVEEKKQGSTQEFKTYNTQRKQISSLRNKTSNYTTPKLHLPSDERVDGLKMKYKIITKQSRHSKHPPTKKTKLKSSKLPINNYLWLNSKMLQAFLAINETTLGMVPVKQLSHKSKARIVEKMGFHTREKPRFGLEKLKSSHKIKHAKEQFRSKPISPGNHNASNNTTSDISSPDNDRMSPNNLLHLKQRLNMTTMNNFTLKYQPNGTHITNFTDSLKPSETFKTNFTLRQEPSETSTSKSTSELEPSETSTSKSSSELEPSESPTRKSSSELEPSETSTSKSASELEPSETSTSKSSSELDPSETSTRKSSSELEPSESSTSKSTSELEPSETSTSKSSSKLEPSESSTSKSSSELDPSETSTSKSTSELEPSETSTSKSSSELDPSETSTRKSSSELEPSESTTRKSSSDLEPSETSTSKYSLELKPSETSSNIPTEVQKSSQVAQMRTSELVKCQKLHELCVIDSDPEGCQRLILQCVVSRDVVGCHKLYQKWIFSFYIGLVAECIQCMETTQ